jgi:hypothetical protein
VRSREGALDLEVGDRVVIIPNHACVVPNLAGALYGMRGGVFSEMICVDAQSAATDGKKRSSGNVFQRIGRLCFCKAAVFYSPWNFPLKILLFVKCLTELADESRYNQAEQFIYHKRSGSYLRFFRRGPLDAKIYKTAYRKEQVYVSN